MCAAEASPEFGAANATGGKADAYWATDDGVTSAKLTVNLKSLKLFDRVVLQEPIQIGQRVKAFSVEARIDGAWTPLCGWHHRWSKTASSKFSQPKPTRSGSTSTTPSRASLFLRLPFMHRPMSRSRASTHLPKPKSRRTRV